MAQRNYVSLSKLSKFLDNLNTKFAALSHKHNLSDISGYAVDSALSATSTNPVQNKVIDAELEAVSTAFEVLEAAIDDKADEGHTHDDRYYTETEVDSKVSAVNTAVTKITNGTTKVPKAAAADTAATAAALTTPRTISLTGDASGSTTFDGSANASITVVIVDDSHNHVITNVDGLQTALDGKSNTSHNHNSAYDAKGSADAALEEAKTYIDTVASGKSDTTHDHDSDYDAKGAANTALDSANAYTDGKVSGLASTTVVDNKITTHNASTAAHNDIRVLISDLTTKLNNFLNVDDTTTDQLSEVLALINANKGTLDSLTTNKINVSDIVNNLTTNSTSKVLSAAQGVAIKALIDALQEELDSHGHEIADVSGLQTALNGKAASSHGTHVTYSSTAPVMDGTAAVGTAATVSRSDHRHPTDTTRAAKTDFDSHTSNTTMHLTAAERTNWNAAYTHSNNKSNPHGVTAAQVGALPSGNVSGTANKVAKFTASNKVGNSNITDDGSTITLGTKIVVQGNGSSYNEGIRILPASNNWSNIFFSADTTTSGEHDGGWLIGRRGVAGNKCGAIGDFTIENNASDGAGLTLHKNGNMSSYGSKFTMAANKVSMQYDSTNECLNFTFA